MKQTIQLIFILFFFILAGCKNEQETVVIHIDGEKEISGEKIALKDINPDLPTNWQDFNYLVLEMKITTPQRFHIGFTTETGYNELRVHSYTPNGWSKLALPLNLYREAPKAHFDVAGLVNQPRYTGRFNIGGQRHPLVGVDSIGFRLYQPIGNSTIEIKSVELAVEDPGDEYLGETPVLDKFGQWNLANFEDKIHSLKQLQNEWQEEDELLDNYKNTRFSKYGGDLNNRVKPTGFFHTEKIGDKWWFVDPEGYLFLSLGVDVVRAGDGGDVHYLDKRRNFCGEIPPARINELASRENAAAFGNWNLHRRFGENSQEKANEHIIKRMNYWGLNTIANWSDKEVVDINKMPFMLQFEDIGIHEGILGLANIYEEGFAEKVENAIRDKVEPYAENPWLIGYFVANEPAWYGREDRLIELILGHDDDFSMKLELLKYIGKEDNEKNRKAFVHATFDKFLEIVNQSFRKQDSNHLNLGMRFSHVPGDELLKICGNRFDVFSFNCYEMYPQKEVMDKLLQVTNIPLVIGEYHFGTINRGMSQALVQVETQQERGEAYQFYTENAFAHPGLIGVAYFQWADEDLTGRGYDGENYNCGLVDVTDRPYPHMVDAIQKTSGRIYEIHQQKLEPVNNHPKRFVGYDWPPGQW